MLSHDEDDRHENYINDYNYFGDDDKTQCKDEFRNLSGCVTEILTVSRINIFFFENTMRKLRSIAFQPCISWGGQYF